MPALPGVPATAATHCPYCALQCGMTLRATGAGVEVEPRGGGLCQKGWTAAELLDHPDRLTQPLLDGVPATWDAALDRVAGTLRRLRAEHGPDAVAVFGGGGLTNEKAYALGKFARVALGTRYVDYNGRFCMSSAAAGGIRAFGVDRGLPFPAADLAHADVILLAGANSAETMPPFTRHLNAQQRAGGALIVVDPRATSTARQATLHLQPTPGTDLAVANALLHVAIAEGLLDGDYIATRTTGFDEVRATVAGYWPARVERLSGVPAADLEAAARLLGSARRAVILTGRGAEQHAQGTDTVTAYINLALALGLPGRPGSGYGCITGQGNGQGGREHVRKAARGAGLGRGRGVAAGTRGVGHRAPRPPRHPRRTSRAAGVRLEPGGVGTQRRARGAPAARAGPVGGGRLRTLGDGAARARCPADGAMGRGGRDDDRPGGPGPAPARAAPATRRRPHRPGDPRRARDQDGLRRGVRSRPAGRLRGAAPRLGRRDGRLRRHLLGPARRRRAPVLAVPGAGSSRHTAPVRRPVRHTGRARPVHRGRAAAGRRGRLRRVPPVPDHRTGAGALPVRRADPAGRPAA